MHRVLFCGFLLLFALPPSARAADRDRHVIVVCIDGLAAYLLDDSKAPLPTIRRLAREGTVVARGMKVSNPSVTWPNHTTIITGVRPEKHGVLANGVLVRGAVGMPTMVDPNGISETWSVSRHSSTTPWTPGWFRGKSTGLAPAAPNRWPTVFRMCPTRCCTARPGCGPSWLLRTSWSTRRKSRSQPTAPQAAT